MIFVVLVLRTSPPRPHSQAVPQVPVLEAGLTGLLSDDGDWLLAVCICSTSLNIVSTSPTVSVPWCLAGEAKEWSSNIVIIMTMSTTEVWCIASINIYTLYIRYLHLDLNSNTEIGLLI